MTAKILVVDDEPDLEDLVRQKFRRQIKDGSITFGFAHDGVEALALIAEEGDFDMVVSDINMPRMDGLTVLAKLQEEATRFSTVIVSAYGDMANIRTAMNRGAFDFLTKPIDFTDFETTIRKTIAHVGALKNARERQAEAERAHASLSRYFSPNLARSLAADADALAPGGERREIATLFTDIAGFTPLVESLDPKQLARLLSGYLEGMTEVVFAHEGTVAKIIGDAIHVLFGAPADQLDSASRAIACALALDTSAEQYRDEWKARGTPLGVTRIGVHAGPAIVGNFGGGRLFDYTAYGDTINTAARLEAVNKQLGSRICVSAAAAERAPGFSGRPVGDPLLRGRSEPMDVLRVFRRRGLGADRARSGLLAYSDEHFPDRCVVLRLRLNDADRRCDRLAIGRPATLLEEPPLQPAPKAIRPDGPRLAMLADCRRRRRRRACGTVRPPQPAQ
jgi:adenylate cyclase